MAASNGKTPATDEKSHPPGWPSSSLPVSRPINLNLLVFDKLSDKENQIVLWYTKQFKNGHYTYAAQFYGLYDRWLTSLIQFKADFEQEGLMLSALAQQNTKKNKKLMS